MLLSLSIIDQRKCGQFTYGPHSSVGIVLLWGLDALTLGIRTLTRMDMFLFCPECGPLCVLHDPISKGHLRVWRYVIQSYVVWICERTIPAERPPLVGEVSVNFCGYKVPRGQRDGYLRPYFRFSRPEPLLFQVAPQLHWRGWMDPVPDLLLVRKSGSAGNRTRTSGSVDRNSGHWTTEASPITGGMALTEQMSCLSNLLMSLAVS
jgi:hypothetical protein